MKRNSMGFEWIEERKKKKNKKTKKTEISSFFLFISASRQDENTQLCKWWEIILSNFSLEKGIFGWAEFRMKTTRYLSVSILLHARQNEKQSEKERDILAASLFRCVVHGSVSSRRGSSGGGGVFHNTNYPEFFFSPRIFRYLMPTCAPSITISTISNLNTHIDWIRMQWRWDIRVWLLNG